MVKYTQYDGRIIESVSIDNVAFVSMSNILNNILPGAWGDYKQVLNSNGPLITDLGILHLPDDSPTDTECSGFFVPVHNISKWLYTIAINNIEESLQDRFRMYRRDCESALRVTWSMEVADVIVNRLDWLTPDFDQYNIRHAEYVELFKMYGIPILPSVIAEGNILDLVYEAAASKESGDIGKRVVNTIDYISDLPMGNMIFNYVDDCLCSGRIESVDSDTAFSFLDKTISFLTSHFIGEKNAK